MTHLFALTLTIVLLLSGPCGTAPAQQKGPWSIKFTTSGGFAGVGTGNLTVSSEGNFHYEEPSRPETRKGCDSHLRPKQLQPLTEAVEQLNPKGWNRPDLNIAAPDAFGYRLEFWRKGDAAATTVQWYDNTKDKLPEDLKRLSDVLMQTMKTACRPGPS